MNNVRDEAHLLHALRTSGLPRGSFDKEHKGVTWVLIFLAGVVAGILSGLIVEWLS